MLYPKQPLFAIALALINRSRLMKTLMVEQPSLLFASGAPGRHGTPGLVKGPCRCRFGRAAVDTARLQMAEAQRTADDDRCGLV